MTEPRFRLPVDLIESAHAAARNSSGGAEDLADSVTAAVLDAVTETVTSELIRADELIQTAMNAARRAAATRDDIEERAVAAEREVLRLREQIQLGDAPNRVS